MTINELCSSVSASAPPADLGPALQALWWLRKGPWDEAHKRVQEHEGQRDCDLVHAHLHRQEGDIANATYWYRLAGRPVATMSLQDEWQAIASELLVGG